MNNIQKIFSNIKGNNYEVKNQINIINVLGNNIEVPDWVYLNFSNIHLKLKDIENNFESFFSNEATYEKNYINKTITQIIKSNFKKSLDNIISSFGNDFFERAFKFNEYFRVKDLYNNLEYSLVQTVKYYISKNKDINETNKELPKELKEKMYNLNNIDLIITKNKNSIIGLIKTKIEEFIKYLKDDLINDYIEFMKNDAFISMCFDNSIRQILNTNLNNVKDNLENTYVYILESYLNDKFFDLYRQTIDKETINILNLINDLRNYLMTEMIDLFKFEPENILEDINNLMIKTLNSINEYNSHLTSFRILDELIEYLNNYGQNNIKPIYDEFKKQLDIISNNQIKSNFEKNSKAYENSYDLDAFIKLSNTTYINLKNDYIDNMTSYLNYYYTNFQNSFENKINGENNELINLNLDESFEKLLLNYDNTKLLIKTLKEFNEFEKTISKNINNINICYKECKKLIENNNYEEENEDIFNKKSEYLKEFSLNYYHQVNESYYKIKLYLNNTLNNMYDDLNKCINITYEELIKEYKKLSEEEPLNEEYRNNEKKLNIDTYKFETEDTTYYITTEIKNLESNAKFNMELSFENNDYKKPKLFASIINKSAPKNMVLDIYSLYGYCAKKGITIDNSFNDVTYKMNLLYEPKSSNINVTTFTNFEKFEFTNEIYEYEDSDETDCFVVAYIKFCVNTLKCNNKKIFFNEKKFKDKKEYKETKFIKY